jgi:hypothetical protein
MAFTISFTRFRLCKLLVPYLAFLPLISSLSSLCCSHCADTYEKVFEKVLLYLIMGKPISEPLKTSTVQFTSLKHFHLKAS